MTKRIAIIIGAGPAGLTAAYELLKRSSIRPIIFEATNDIGGISKTVNYKGNRIDIGGHRFFSKSDRVMSWWQAIMPLERGADRNFEITYRNERRGVTALAGGPDPRHEDLVMLVRQRFSRIFFLRHFFPYPLTLSASTALRLGSVRIARVLVSYLIARLMPIKVERSLEDFFINRFGRELYVTFFKDYTEKVWGVPCGEIKPEWGAQRVKGLSITKAALHAFRSPLKRSGSVGQKGVETSLIERFLYPKHGPGQMWEEVARLVLKEATREGSPAAGFHDVEPGDFT